MRAYFQRPDVKEKMRAYSQRPDVKEKMRAYFQRPDVKEKMRAYFQANRDKLLAQQRARREAKKKHHLSLTKEAPPA
jgi:hypothetical protein